MRERFQMNLKRVQVLRCLLTYSVTVSSLLAMLVISWWQIVASSVDRTENTMFCLLHDFVEKRPILVSTVDQVCLASGRVDLTAG